MILKKLHLENFRCFENLEIVFDDSLSLLVGVNATGKSSILNAASIAMGSFLLGIDGQSSKCIGFDNVRHTTGRSGTLLELEPQYPTKVEAEGTVDSESVSWSRSVNTSSGHTTTKDAKAISGIAAAMQKRIKSGEDDVVLPLLAYYGTDRVANKASLSERAESKRFSRFSGYASCLDPRSNERHLLYWMKKLTYAEFQNQSPAPELKAIKDAVLTVYNSADDSNRGFQADDFRYNLADDRLEFVLADSGDQRNLAPYAEMSDGYRSIIGLVADIARRMGTLNPQLAYQGEMLATPGIVLIDEIDQHLHPAWQRHIIADLKAAFPQIQIIATTHSPSIINSVEAKNIVLLDTDGIHGSSMQTYGRDANFILKHIMRVASRPDEIQKALKNVYSLMDEERFSAAKELLDEVEMKIGESDPAVTKARVLLELEMAD